MTDCMIGRKGEGEMFIPYSDEAVNEGQQNDQGNQPGTLRSAPEQTEQTE